LPIVKNAFVTENKISCVERCILGYHLQANHRDLDNALASFYKEFWGEEGEEEEEEEEEGPQTKKRKGGRTDDRAGGVTGMFGG
jgi:hypothetical protein